MHFPVTLPAAQFSQLQRAYITSPFTKTLYGIRFANWHPTDDELCVFWTSWPTWPTQKSLASLFGTFFQIKPNS